MLKELWLGVKLLRVGLCSLGNVSASAPSVLTVCTKSSLSKSFFFLFGVGVLFPLNGLRAFNCYIHSTLQTLLRNNSSKMKFLVCPGQLSLIYWHQEIMLAVLFWDRTWTVRIFFKMEWKSYLRMILSKYLWESMMCTSYALGMHVIFFTCSCFSVFGV